MAISLHLGNRVTAAWAGEPSLNQSRPQSSGDEPADKPTDTPSTPAWREVWAGVDASRTTTSVWSGSTTSPFGSSIEPGYRLRVVAGAGQYTYDGWRVVNRVPAPDHFRGLMMFTDVMAGYQFQWGELTVKPLVGATLVQHTITPLDPRSPLLGLQIGPKAALETWLNATPSTWINVDGTWSAVHESMSIKGRVGYRVWQDLSLGVEASALSDVTHDVRRAGAFVRFAWSWGEIAVNGGLTGNAWQDTAKQQSPYAGLLLFGRY